jgi:hypothetical protein
MEHMRLAGGGEEVETNCFRRTSGGFLPRGFLTPMEVWAKAYPPELISEGGERDAVIIAGAEPPAGSPNAFSNRPGFFVGKSLRHVKFYPGDEIKAVLSANEGKGIVEIPSLKGLKWWEDEEQAVSERRAPKVPGIPQRLNADFFPTPPPAELRLLEEMIRKGGDLSAHHSRLAEEMFPSCMLFRAWAEMRLSVEHGMLRERKSHQYVHAYSPVGRELLRQLEMQPQDRILESNAEEYRDLIRAAISQNNANQMTPEFIGQVVQQILVAQNAAKADLPESVGAEGSQVETAVEDQHPVEVASPNRGGRPRKTQE